jgi:hypothetical protein
MAKQHLMSQASADRAVEILLVEDNPGDVRLAREALGGDMPRADNPHANRCIAEPVDLAQFIRVQSIEDFRLTMVKPPQESA